MRIWRKVIFSWPRKLCVNVIEIVNLKKLCDFPKCVCVCAFLILYLFRLKYKYLQ